MTADDPLRRLNAGLAEDDRIARAAIGKRGSKAGALVQHWQWKRIGDDEVILTDGSTPIDAAYCYDDQFDRDKVDGSAVLLTSERYPANVADWQLEDRLLPNVEEPHAGAAQHIARHDVARVLRQVEAIRDVVKECEALMRNATVVTEGYIAAESILARLASIYPEDTTEMKGEQ
ncbi:DUF6221 family protein [Nocardia wallacei]|uniref:DUF6221 family protein n=1 Tax=Nocardia wallacei TaxID=480035 RepID=UPI0024552A3F|nr:DUF6221 family protein [Nocardia wallacei]